MSTLQSLPPLEGPGLQRENGNLTVTGEKDLVLQSTSSLIQMFPRAVQDTISPPISGLIQMLPSVLQGTGSLIQKRPSVLQGAENLLQMHPSKPEECLEDRRGIRSENLNHLNKMVAAAPDYS